MEDHIQNETKIDFVLIKKQHQCLIQNVNPWGVVICICGSIYR